MRPAVAVDEPGAEVEPGVVPGVVVEPVEGGAGAVPGTAGSPGLRVPVSGEVDGARRAVTSTFWLRCDDRFTVESAGRSMYCEIGGIGSLLGEGAPALVFPSLVPSPADVAAIALVNTNCPGGQEAEGGFCAPDDVSSLVDLTQPVIVRL